MTKEFLIEPRTVPAFSKNETIYDCRRRVGCRIAVAAAIALAPFLGGSSGSSANKARSKYSGEIEDARQEPAKTWYTNIDVRTEGDKLIYQAYITCWKGKKPIEAPSPDSPLSTPFPVQMAGEEAPEGTLTIKNLPNPEDFCIDEKHSNVDGAWIQIFEGSK